MDRHPDFPKTGVLKIIGVVLFLSLAASVVNQYPAHAYQLLDLKWPDPSTTFHVDIPGADGLWDEAFEGAMYEWSSATVFQYYIVRKEYSDPCDPEDERNGVRFHDSNCGDAWGSTTLAVCNYWYVGSTLVEADIVFNSDRDWNVYWTPWRSDVADFRRVAVHELGHALGLTHEDSGVPAIMRTYAGDITTPQQDDIAGVAAIYGSTECTLGITPSGGSFPSGGGTKTVSVTASSSSCSWTVSHSLSWVNVSPSGGTGTRNVTVTAAPNSGAARSGTLSIAGRTYTVIQAAENDTPVSEYVKKVVDIFSHILFKFWLKILLVPPAVN